VQLETAKRKPRFREESKKEEIIYRNCLPHHKKASSFPNTHEAVRLHFLPMLSTYSRMSKTVQHAGTARVTCEVLAFSVPLYTNVTSKSRPLLKQIIEYY